MEFLLQPCGHLFCPATGFHHRAAGFGIRQFLLTARATYQVSAVQGHLVRSQFPATKLEQRFDKFSAVHDGDSFSSSFGVQLTSPPRSGVTSHSSITRDLNRSRARWGRTLMAYLLQPRIAALSSTVFPSTA